MALSPRGLCLFPPSGAKGGLGWAGVSSWVHSGHEEVMIILIIYLSKYEVSNHVRRQYSEQTT